MSRPHSVIQMAGQRFGHLVVIQRAGRQRKYATWLCLCDCGQKVVVIGHLLRAGRRKSCAVNGHRWVQHRTPGSTTRHATEYSTWRAMLDRCRSKARKNYGYRGIKVCKRWRQFENFLADMGPRPSLAHSIDRYPNNDGNYEPDNCRWATADQQRRNMRSNVYVTWDGKSQLLMDVCLAIGVNRGVVSGRLKMGWPLEDALFVPVRKHKAQKRK